MDECALTVESEHFCSRGRRPGERKDMAVYGCSVDVNLSVLNLIIVQKGEKGIPGQTDSTVPWQLGTKKAGRI